MQKNEKAIYIDLLIDTMIKKQKLLDDIINLTKEQAMLLNQQPFSVESFEETLDKKEILINDLNLLDEGFLKLFNRVKEEVQGRSEFYAEQIKTLQNHIKELTAKGTLIQTLESANKMKIDVALNSKRSEIRQVKMSNQTATKYYKNMMNLNQNDAIFYDKKK